MPASQFSRGTQSKHPALSHKMISYRSFFPDNIYIDKLMGIVVYIVLYILHSLHNVNILGQVAWKNAADILISEH